MKYKYHIERVWGDEVELPDDAKIIGVLEDKGSGDEDGETFIAFLTPIASPSRKQVTSPSEK